MRAYQRVRAVLAEELGLSPSAALIELERRVLAQDPTLAWTAERDGGDNSELVGTDRDGRRRPVGTVTFLFTDLEQSTRLWETHPAAMDDALAAHDRLLREVITAHEGYIFSTAGDAFAAAFSLPTAAVRAAIVAQRAVTAHSWAGPVALQVRMGLHTGVAHERDGDYFGSAVNRAARLMSVAHGGQIVVSLATEQLVRDQMPDEVGLIDLGEHRLRDLSRPEHVFQVVAPELPEHFPPLRSHSPGVGSLPVSVTSFVGESWSFSSS